ncbi:unnamed protein product [Phytomonas sp. Hart1]|nr:unnamed protein product [Phytomonas sp. Hart1]|eukprot:CCW67779.1 unnamed protein product [Phytomonas sp. isolate Hart1]
MTSVTPLRADTQLMQLENYITLSVQLIQQLQQDDLEGAARTAQVIETSSADTSGAKLSKLSPSRAVLNLYHEVFCTASQPSRVEEEEESQSDDDEDESSTSNAAPREDTTTPSSDNILNKSPKCNVCCTDSFATIKSESEDESNSTSSGNIINWRGLQRCVDVPAQKSMNSDKINLNSQLFNILSKIKDNRSREGIDRQYETDVMSLSKAPTSAPEPQTNFERDDDDNPEDEIREMEEQILADIDLRVEEEMKRLAIVRKHR